MDVKGRKVAENKGKNKGRFVVFLVQGDFHIQLALHICGFHICRPNQRGIENIKKHILHCFQHVLCS